MQKHHKSLVDKYSTKQLAAQFIQKMFKFMNNMRL